MLWGGGNGGAAEKGFGKDIIAEKKSAREGIKLGFSVEGEKRGLKTEKFGSRRVFYEVTGAS